MNVFIIPSWYSSPTTVSGIFIQEQAEALATHHSFLNIGISAWGQNDERLLLWSGQPLQSYIKVLRNSKVKSSSRKVKDNLKEYFSPAFTWSNKVAEGNIRRIIKANIKNMRLFHNVLTNKKIKATIVG